MANFDLRTSKPLLPEQQTLLAASSTRVSNSAVASPQETIPANASLQAKDALNLSHPQPAEAQPQLQLINSKPVTRFKGSESEYFALLDKDPVLRAQAKGDATGAMLDFLSRQDVPLAMDKAYTKEAGSVGGGRLLMLLEYTRGVANPEGTWQALKQGPKHFLASHLLTPHLSHFRYVDGESLFPGDKTMTRAFQDSHLWGAKTNQIGHFLCAVETGVRMGQLAKSDLKKSSFDLGIKAANGLLGFDVLHDDADDFSRAGIIGHEMRGDGDGGGFISQMKSYQQLVANGDPQGIRQHWDQAVKAVQEGRHQAAFEHITAISQAIEAPGTPEEVKQNLANPHPRFAPAHQPREGNSHQDIALSVYGYALGYQVMQQGSSSPEAIRNLFESVLLATGSQADAINQAAQNARPLQK